MKKYQSEVNNRIFGLSEKSQLFLNAKTETNLIRIVRFGNMQSSHNTVGAIRYKMAEIRQIHFLFRGLSLKNQAICKWQLDCFRKNVCAALEYLLGIR